MRLFLHNTLFHLSRKYCRLLPAMSWRRRITGMAFIFRGVIAYAVS